MSDHMLNLSKRASASTIGNVVGPMFLGAMINWVLQGVLVSQMIFYYNTRWKTDKLPVRAAVLLLLLLTLLASAMAAWTAYEYTIISRGRIELLGTVPYGLAATPTIDALVIMLIHAMYARIIWFVLPTFSLKTLATSCIGALSVGQLVAAIVVTQRTPRNFHLFSDRCSIAIAAWMGIGGLADLIITVILCAKLLQTRTGLSSTDGVVVSIIKIFIQTGVVSLALQLGLVLMVWTEPNATIGLLFTFSLPAVYANSLLAVLNSRVFAASRSDSGVGELQTTAGVWNRDTSLGEYGDHKEGSLTETLHEGSLRRHKDGYDGDGADDGDFDWKEQGRRGSAASKSSKTGMAYTVVCEGGGSPATEVEKTLGMTEWVVDESREKDKTEAFVATKMTQRRPGSKGSSEEEVCQ